MKHYLEYDFRVLNYDWRGLIRCRNHLIDMMLRSKYITHCSVNYAMPINVIITFENVQIVLNYILEAALIDLKNQRKYFNQKCSPLSVGNGLIPKYQPTESAKRRLLCVPTVLRIHSFIVQKIYCFCSGIIDSIDRFKHGNYYKPFC